MNTYLHKSASIQPITRSSKVFIRWQQCHLEKMHFRRETFIFAAETCRYAADREHSKGAEHRDHLRGAALRGPRLQHQNQAIPACAAAK